jgi:DNA-binding NarL/FixJ family response regulator
LFREGLSQLLAAEDDIVVVGTAPTADELIALCDRHRPDVALVEADGVERDLERLAAGLRRSQPGLRIVGLTVATTRPAEMGRAHRAKMSAVVSRAGGVADILTAVRAPLGTSLIGALVPSRGPVPAAPPPASDLTPRELGVLKLVGAGLTSREISDRLNISHKTVENHKQRIFGKLGVQNQAHAVSVAMRTGVLRPERVIDLAAVGLTP